MFNFDLLDFLLKVYRDIGFLTAGIVVGIAICENIELSWWRSMGLMLLCCFGWPIILFCGHERFLRGKTTTKPYRWEVEAEIKKVLKDATVSVVESLVDGVDYEVTITNLEEGSYCLNAKSFVHRLERTLYGDGQCKGRIAVDAFTEEETIMNFSASDDANWCRKFSELVESSLRKNREEAEKALCKTALAYIKVPHNETVEKAVQILFIWLCRGKDFEYNSEALAAELDSFRFDLHYEAGAFPATVEETHFKAVAVLRALLLHKPEDALDALGAYMWARGSYLYGEHRDMFQQKMFNALYRKFEKVFKL